MSGKRVNVCSVQLVKESSFIYENRRIASPNDAYELGKMLLRNKDREHFVVVCLNTKNAPLNANVVSIGSLNKAIVHPREVFKPAILSNSASVMLFHNHPSNDPTPSAQDISLTKRLIECGDLLGVDVLDHIIICEDSYISLREEKCI